MSPGSKNSPPPDGLRRLAAKEGDLRFRSRMISTIRRLFEEKGYIEIETPFLIPAPAPESHIDAFRVGAHYLQTSPELCMKQLIAAGFEKIFQICRGFREGERGERHLPEFTLLEWYRAGADYRDLMNECEGLILELTRDLLPEKRITYQGMQIDMEGPWDRLSVEEAFERYAGLSPEKALETNRFDEIMVDKIEPRLGINKPIFLYDYPAPLAALARLKASAPHLAERFELYIGGVELANAFSELTDASRQRARFEKDQGNRRRLGKPLYPIPETFLKALPAMPPSAGIALGVDRLVMILTDRSCIDDVVAFTPETL